MRHLFSAAALAALVLSCSSPEQQQETAYSPAILDTIRMVENNLCGTVLIEDSVNTFNLQQRMAGNKVHGLSIAVVRNYQVQWAKAYGFADTATKRPVTVQTLFQAASISKSLNGVGVLRLVQDKRLDLNADINSYLKSWRFPYDTVSHGKTISVAHLLSHTAGLTVHGFAGYEPGDTIPTLQQVLDGTPPANSDPVRSMFEPGLRFTYAGGGTTISQQLVQDITGQPYHVYMRQVLDAMGMTTSTYEQPPPAAKAGLLSYGYRGNGEVVKGNYHVYPEQAAAGLWTNPTELAQYIIETQLALQGTSAKVLNQEMTRLRLTPYIDSNAALGVFVMSPGNHKYFNHGGANEGFRCTYYGSFEGGNGVVVMLNSDNGSMLDEVVNSVAKVYGWPGFYQPKTRKAIAISDTLLQQYLGDYLLGNDTLTVNIAGGRPKIHYNHDEGYTIYFASPHDFFARELDFDLKFEQDASGKVTGIYFKNSGGEFRAKKK